MAKVSMAEFVFLRQTVPMPWPKKIEKNIFKKYFECKTFI